jgi:O-antigen/teichoic acid export membrane protein
LSPEKPSGSEEHLPGWREGIIGKAKGPSAGTLGTSLLGQAFIVVTGVVAARALGVEGRGTLALLWLLPMTLALLGGLGIPQATTYYVAREADNAAAVVRISVVVVLGLAAVLSLGYAAGLVLIAENQDFSATDSLLSVLLVPLFLAQNLAAATLLGMKRYAAFNLCRVVPVFLYAAGILLLFGLGDATLSSIFTAGTASWAIGAAIAWYLVRRELPDAGREAAVTRSGIVWFGVRGIIGTVSPVDDVRVDQLFVGLLLDARALGLYVSAVAFCNLPRFVAQSIGSVNYPRVAGAPDSEAAWATTIRATKIGLLVVALTVAGLILTMPFLLPFLFGEEFKDAVGLAYILLPAAYFLSVHRLLTELARGLGHPGYGSITELVNLAVFLSGLLVFATPATASGVATAVLAGGISSALVLSLLLVRLRRMQPRGGFHP